MIVPYRPKSTGAVFYPETDGKPMAENTLQAQWIVTIMTNLDRQYRDDPNVYVAMDNFIYPVEGDNTTVTAPRTFTLRSVGPRVIAAATKFGKKAASSPK